MMRTSPVLLTLVFCGACAAQEHPAADQVFLENGISLQDWVDMAESRLQTAPLDIGSQAARYIARYGGYRELMMIAQRAGDIIVHRAHAISRNNAETTLAKLTGARRALGDWPGLVLASAQAKSLLGRQKEAIADLVIWLSVIPRTSPQRTTILKLLSLAESDPEEVTRFFERPMKFGRPTFPATVDSALLQRLEELPSYSSTRIPPHIRYQIRYHDKWQGKSNFTVETISSTDISRLSGGYFKQTVHSSSKFSHGTDSEHKYEAILTVGGLVNVYDESISKDGKNPFKGSLRQVSGLEQAVLPPVSGKKTLKYSTSRSASIPKWGSSADTECISSEAIPATRLHPVLIGEAVPLSCSVNTRFEDPSLSSGPVKRLDYYLTDLGILYSNLRASDGTIAMLGGVIPKAGDTIEHEFSGSVVTRTYSHVALTVSEE